jgi:glucose-6-phosphate 1-dehydrogenase
MTQNHILVIFGASGDLTYRKLVPAVYDLHEQGKLPEGFALLGTSRTEFSDEAFREKMREGIEAFALRPASEETMESFLAMLHYVAIDTKGEETYVDLKTRMEELAQLHGTDGNAIFYLSTPPSLYGVIPKYLASHGLSQPEQGWRRLIIEKPFGYNYETAHQLNQELLSYFQEEQLYRIDHYLGKETVQNLLVTRFANGIYEPLWNRNYIHHVEITSAEDIGVGERGGYYDSSGAMRDMVQNHLLQLVGLTAMEPPQVIEAQAIRNETLKVFQALRPITGKDILTHTIRGQYMASHIKGQAVKGYREETGVPDDSRTPTFVAMKFYIDNWRWGGVPFFIRTGKCLPTKVTEIVVHFKQTPHRLFLDECDMPHNMQNKLVIRIQPNEGILLKMGVKVPGAGFKVDEANMDFHYSDLGDAYLPTAYERLLLDAMQGDQTLFTRGDAVEAAWRFVDPILQAWESGDDSIPLHGYPAGTWGPDSADEMIGDGLTWRYPCRNLVDDGSYCEL